MNTVLNVLVGVIALSHVGFWILESFLWKTPFGLKTFHMTPEMAEATSVLALNQGFYNGFLAAGLAWSLLAADPAQAWSLKLFFLGCVLLAGLVGGATAARSIFFIQALPAAIALAALFMVKP